MGSFQSDRFRRRIGAESPRLKDETPKHAYHNDRCFGLKTLVDVVRRLQTARQEDRR